MNVSQLAASPGLQAVPSVALSATFTAEPLRETLSFWLGRLALDLPVNFAPYNQVFQQLLDHSSLLAFNRGGVNVILVRVEDWARFRDAADTRPETLEADAHHLVECLRSAAQSFSSPLLVMICPSSPAFLGEAGRDETASRIADLVESGLKGLGTVHLVRSSEVEDLYPVSKRDDPHGDELGHVPYTPEYFTALGTLLARKINALRMTPYKVIALDCDDTLWSGICGEDGPGGVVIDEPHRRLQEFVLAQQGAGMMLALCSKNNMEEVLETFRVHAGMPLRFESFVASRINWNSKSANLASMAEELQLGLDSFVFIDDNAQECGEVSARRPEVLTLQLPRHPEEIHPFLRHVWAFDRLRVTEEDKLRVATYTQRAERARLERQAKTLGEFIESLRLQVDISDLTPAQLPRAAQLTERTNQMNFTTIRRTEAEIQSLLASGGAECLVVEVADRFGSYGLTGLTIFGTVLEALRVDTFLLSCRVLGRGVEHRLLARLGEIAVSRGLHRVEIPFFQTSRNQPALIFLESVCAQFKVRTEKGFLFAVPSHHARDIVYKPSARVVASPTSEAPGAAAPAREPVDYAYIANHLRRVDQIQEMVGANSQGTVSPAASADAPRTGLEAELAALWGDLLRLPRVGVHENFFDLGGHSLLAVQLLSRVRHTYQVDLPLDVVYSSAFTVAELARAIEVRQIEQADPAQYADILAELESLTDDEVRDLLAREKEATSGEGGR